MSNRDEYLPGPAAGTEVRKEGEKWTLIVVRELSHPPEKVWKALTDLGESARMGAVRCRPEPRRCGAREAHYRRNTNVPDLGDAGDARRAAEASGVSLGR